MAGIRKHPHLTRARRRCPSFPIDKILSATETALLLRQAVAVMPLLRLRRRRRIRKGHFP
jgi:hypothetical protein